jgi:hypothetical protein
MAKEHQKGVSLSKNILNSSSHILFAWERRQRNIVYEVAVQSIID